MRRALAMSVLLMAGVIAVRVLACTQQPPPVVLDEGALPRGGPALAAADAPASIEELRRRVAAVLAAEGVPGAAIALVDRDGPMWIGGVGVADRETSVPVDADTVFRVGSITKSVVGLGVMRLVEQDRLALDRPLRELMPERASPRSRTARRARCWRRRPISRSSSGSGCAAARATGSCRARGSSASSACCSAGARRRRAGACGSIR